MELVQTDLMQKFATLMKEFEGSGELFLCFQQGQRYSIAQVARFLMLSPPSVINLVGYGKLLASKGGKFGYLQVECADLIAYIKVHRPSYAYIVLPENMICY